MTTANQAPRGLLPTWRAAASLRGQAVRFAAVGIISTIAYVASYAGLRTGAATPASGAVALFIAAVVDRVRRNRGERHDRASSRHRPRSATIGGRGTSPAGRMRTSH